MLNCRMTEHSPVPDKDGRAARPWPLLLEFRRQSKLLFARFDDGQAFTIPYELLRVESPSAEVQGHGPGDKKIVRGKADVAINAVHRRGNYAVQIVFDDGHESGIFSWDGLYRLGRDQHALLDVYRAACAKKDEGPGSD